MKALRPTQRLGLCPFGFSSGGAACPVVAVLGDLFDQRLHILHVESACTSSIRRVPVNKGVGTLGETRDKKRLKQRGSSKRQPSRSPVELARFYSIQMMGDQEPEETLTRSIITIWSTVIFPCPRRHCSPASSSNGNNYRVVGQQAVREKRSQTHITVSLEVRDMPLDAFGNLLSQLAPSY